MTIHFHDLVGLIGIAMIVGTYLLLQTGRMRSEQLAYSVLNALGALCVLFSIFFAFNLSAFIIESFWVLISAIGIVRYFASKRAASARDHPGP